MLYFENDYCEGAHPAILQKLAETNFCLLYTSDAADE